MLSELPKPGHHSLTSCVLINDSTNLAVDLSDIFKNFTITESINQNEFTFKADLVETATNLYSQLTGDEVVAVEWVSPPYIEDLEPRQMVFRVTDIGGLSFDDNTEAFKYTIIGIDELSYDQSFNVVSTSYSDTLSNIAEKVFNHAVDNSINSPLTDTSRYKFNKDETEGIVDIIIPKESPFATMSYLRGYTYSSAYPSSMYLFFQNKDGYNFKNIESLIEEGKKELTTDIALKKISYQKSTQEMANISDKVSLAYNIAYLSQFNKSSLHASSTSGALHGTVKEIDYMFKDVTIHTKKIDTKEFIGFDKKEELSTKTLDTYNKEPQASEYIYVDGLKTNRPNLAQSILNKKIGGALFYSNMVQVTIPGNSDMSAGKLFNLQVSNRLKVDLDSGAAMALDENLSGLYLIKDVQHIFDSLIYTNIITLVRSNYAGK